MYRPPKPAMKSTQLFHPLQKLLHVETPVGGNLLINQEDNLIRSMRDSIPSEITINNINNPVGKGECKEISNKNGSIKNEGKVSIAKAFKIRNYTYEGKRVKENTIPIKSNIKNMKQYLGSVRKIEHESIQHKTNIYFSLASYPESFQLHHLSNRVSCVHTDSEISGVYSEWGIIIQYSLYLHVKSEELNLKKLKRVIEKFITLHPGINIIFKVKDQSQISTTVKQLKELGIIKCACVIFPKQKFIERVTWYDLHDISKNKALPITKFIILTDLHDPVRELPIVTERNPEQLRLISKESKYLFLGFKKLSSIFVFFDQGKVLAEDHQVLLYNQDIFDITSETMMMEEVSHKVVVAKNIKELRCGSRKSQSFQNQHFENEKQKRQKAKELRNEEFKRKMIAYVKILEQQHSCFPKNKSIDVNSKQRSSVQQKKPPSQIFQQLFKINSHIMEQIHKYQQHCKHLQKISQN